MIMFCVLLTFFASAQKTYYVSSQNGNDNNSGLEQNLAFKSIQKAVNSVNEGDTVKILSGIYTGENDSPWSEIFMSISGSEEKYITFSGVPDAQGKLPTIVSASVKGIDLLGSSYLIIENLEFVPADEDVKGMINDPSFGLELWRARRAIGIDNGSHHIIIRNNYVHDFPGNGIAIGGSEVVLIEGNLVEHCAFQSQNGNSGISSYQPANLNVSSFPDYPNHRIIYKNNVSRYNVNLRGFLGGGNRITDGNGIIVDDHIQDQKENGVPYNSRTLLIGNVCYGNGGQGINVFSSDNVDVYNNTLFDNAQSTRISNPAYPIAIGDSQLSIGRVKNARVKNNILYNSNASKTTISRYQDENISYDQNIHWNATGNPESLSTNDLIVNPKLKSIQALNESQTNLLATSSNPFNINGASATLFTPTKNNNFPVHNVNLQSSSPAINAGVNVGFGDIVGTSIDIGAIEFDGVVNTLEDKIISTSVPNQVVAGKETIITISYEAKEDRDISIVFQLDSSPYTVYKSNRARVSAGVGTINVPLSIPENTPIGNNEYQFQVYITSVGGNWNNRLDNLNKPNIDCISEDIGITQVLEVGAKGNCSGEQIEILLDNKPVVQFTLTNNIEVYRYSDYKEGQNIKVAFINDDNSTCDLNAYIDWIKICDILYQTEDYSNRTGCGSSEWLYCNGNFDFGNLSCGQNRNGEITKESIILYPNPVEHSFFVENNKDELLSIKVMNLEGKVLRTFKSEINDTKLSVDINDLPKGVYLVTIFSKDSKEQKAIKIYKE
ncbi:Por secretion system C-terminal sorting domain-containing protein [Aquimarina amphilecti]|uniref:Por secretion system C-terminal sorting domain-containing protein n=2 Tax=Aquimarina amphilecti TaxID=1038014 RepID=A0A1H7MVG8_AQUAM|nr:Por secretion system C-terminal sorting domain-containing protein [Aquimarina amphilecti]